MLARGALYAGVLALAAACASAREPPLTSLPLATASAPPAPPPRRWPRLAEVARWPAVPPRPFLAAGHGTGTWTTVVRISANLTEQYALLPGRVSVPPGAIAAAFHTAEDGTPAPTFVMERLPDGTWDYLALDAQGVVLPGADLSLCGRCHAESPSGSLFGLPASARPPAEPGAGGAGGAPAP